VKQMVLNGSSRNSQPMRLCDKCETKKPPEGGIQMGPGRWYCAACWLKRVQKEQKR
jgi:hypothetical protein